MAAVPTVGSEVTKGVLGPNSSIVAITIGGVLTIIATQRWGTWWWSESAAAVCTVSAKATQCILRPNSAIIAITIGGVPAIIDTMTRAIPPRRERRQWRRGGMGAGHDAWWGRRQEDGHW